MQSRPKRQQFPSRSEGANPNITSAVGLEETAGHLRARRDSLFMRTVMWITGLICTAFLLGSLAQAWSNSQLAQKLQQEQQKAQQLQRTHGQLVDAVNYYKDPGVIEKEARQQLGYIKPGENPVIIVSAGDQGKQNTQKQKQVVIQQGFWQNWWDTFFGD